MHRRGGGADAARRAGPRRSPPAGNLCATYPTRYGADKEAAILLVALQVVLLQQCTTVAILYSHHSLSFCFLLAAARSLLPEAYRTPNLF